MADIIGSITPRVEITEADQFEGPTRTVNLIDAAGRLHGRIQWLSDEVDEVFHRSVLRLCADTMKCAVKAGRSPSAAS